MSLDDEIRAELRELESSHRRRVPRVVEGAQGPRIMLDGVDVLNFASNDYLSLAGDRRLARAVANVLDEVGVGAGASRLIVGNHRSHEVAERAIGDWLRYPGVRLFNSGYAANVGVLTSLLAAGDVVFSDELNHASIIDGCRLSRADVVVYPHRDLVALERALLSHRGRRRIVVSESLFSMDGDVADVGALAALCKRHDAALVLDEAHAVGVWGPEGRGIAAQANVVPDVLIGTCGKALGSFGAFVATSQAIAAWLWNRARPFVFSTALPPMIPAAVVAAIEIIRNVEGAERRRDLVARAIQLRQRLRGVRDEDPTIPVDVDRVSEHDKSPPLRGDAVIGALGGQSSARVIGERASAIVPILIGDDRAVMQVMRSLLESRLFVQGIRPPTVPEGGARLRIGLCAGHSSRDVDVLANAIVSAVPSSTTNDNAKRSSSVARNSDERST